MTEEDINNEKTFQPNEALSNKRLFPFEGIWVVIHIV